ncbi:FUSC family protein [Falsirhodobacter xinxiangensis]|uniref:FUSC family protein n=1 Tax=Falsirhodobacter xinxiangensis TaxID=2530049 RepID=UPI0010AA2A62|nr:FUSC family protein [Rhodobacter xinxiangensis]
MTNFWHALRDPVLRLTAIRLTLAAMIAIIAATILGMSNPWWAAMATWMIGQPPRGLLLERSLAQIAGTIAGAIAGLMIALTSQIAVEIGLLALWLGGCCGLANTLRHQRAYAAAVAGLTASVMVSLTAGTTIDLAHFAMSRIGDTFIGVAAVIGVAAISDQGRASTAPFDRIDDAIARGLRLAGATLRLEDDELHVLEAEFLSLLAVISSTAEDLAAGSWQARGYLKTQRNLLAGLLDLVVLTRLIRRVEGNLEPGTPLHLLQSELDGLATLLDTHGTFETDALRAVASRLTSKYPELSDLLADLVDEVESIGADQAAIALKAADHRGHSLGATSRIVPRSDKYAMRNAVARGVAIISLSGSIWLTSGWEAGRFLVLGASILTALFAMLDEPLPLVRQALAGGMVAVLAAVGWRLEVIPAVGHHWISLALTVPLFFMAAHLQAKRSAMFLGLTFNMFFAVMSRPVEMMPAAPMAVTGAGLMLVAGVMLSYIFYRWLIPMTAYHKRRNLEASIRFELAAISRRRGGPWAVRHLARLRHLVLELSVRTRSNAALGDAMSAMSMGHIVYRMGRVSSGQGRERLREYGLAQIADPISDPAALARDLRSRNVAGATGRLEGRLISLMSQELDARPKIFTTR